MAELMPNVVLEEIRENQTRLDNCPRHYFPTLPEITLGVKFNCARCGGTICALQVAAYVRGYAAAGGNPDDVIPGWSGA